MPAHFKFGIVLARVVCGWALDDSKLRVVGGKVRDDVPCKLDFLSTRKMEMTPLSLRKYNSVAVEISL